jgi:hypothetical protein
MAANQRTGKQKALLVISIIIIVIAVLGILSCISIALGGGILASYLAASHSTSANNVLAVGGLSAVVGFIGVVACVIDLLIGILGVRGANDASKIGPFNVFAYIGLAIAIIDLVCVIVAMCTGTGSRGTMVVSAIIDLILPALCVWLGRGIKNEA